ncbi:hypothetical protein BB561_005259 [Smittium simulii]|uniref:RING-type E3 ubiquitin transferase n=1 Tax=Smittium simulii TaxID=133385 RepID=A0A2T9YB75_9FUNG|nr:hypothetical protein BB561_005259 [Smittium simulii]
MADEIICRVCRCEATDEEPLFYPCKCSGSIKYVHEDCLLEWLKHSNKKKCELCGYEFKISPVYSKNMPSQLPIFIIIKRLLIKEFHVLVFALRAIFMTSLWTILLPNLLVSLVRFYLWCSLSLIYGDTKYSNNIPTMNSFSDLLFNNTSSSNSTLNTIPLTQNPPSAYLVIFQSFSEFISVFFVPIYHLANYTIYFFQAIYVTFLGNENYLVFSQVQKDHLTKYLSEILKNSLSGSMLAISAIVFIMGLFFMRDYIITNENINRSSDESNSAIDDETFELMYQEIESLVKNVYSDNSKNHTSKDPLCFTKKKNSTSNLLQIAENSKIKPRINNNIVYTSLQSNYSSGINQNTTSTIASQSKFKNYNSCPEKSSSNLSAKSYDSENYEPSDNFTQNDFKSDLIIQDTNLIGDNTKNFEFKFYDTDDEIHSEKNSTSEKYKNKYIQPDTDGDDYITESSSSDISINNNITNDFLENSNTLPLENLSNIQNIYDNLNQINANPHAQYENEANAPEIANQVNQMAGEPQLQEAAEDIFQALGFRGGILAGIQYLILVFLVAVLFISFFIWIPYTTGKYLMAINFLGLPFTILQGVTSYYNYAINLLAKIFLPKLYIVAGFTEKIITNYIFPLLLKFFQIGKLEKIIIILSPKYDLYIAPLENYFDVLSYFSFPKYFFNQLSLSTINSNFLSLVSYTGLHDLYKLSSLAKPYFTSKNLPQDETTFQMTAAVAYGYLIFLVLIATIDSLFGNSNTLISKNTKIVLKMAKVSGILVVEIMLFPIILGSIIELYVIGLIKDWTPANTISLWFEYPLFSALLHWAIGAFYMFKFANFVSICRKILRKGVLWFIRDPKNPHFQPMREILNKPIGSTAKKIFLNIIIYFVTVSTLFVPVIQLLKNACSKFFPIDLKYIISFLKSSNYSSTMDILPNLYSSNIPINLFLIEFVIPALIIWINPASLALDITYKWYGFISHKLRLSEFLIGKVVPNEMGEFKFISLKSYLLYQLGFKALPRDLVDLCWYIILEKYENKFHFSSPFISPDPTIQSLKPIIENELNTISSKLIIFDDNINHCHYLFKYGSLFEQVTNKILKSNFSGLEYKLDVQIIRAPKNDNINIIPNRKMIVPVKPNGLPENPAYNYFLIDLIAGERGEQYLRRKYGISNSQSIRFKQDDYHFLFAPSHFEYRNLFLLLLLLVSIALVPVFVLYIPLITGDFLYNIAPSYNPNLLYAYTIGITFWMIIILVVTPLYRTALLFVAFGRSFINKVSRTVLKKIIEENRNEVQTEPIIKYYNGFVNIVFGIIVFGIVIPSIIATLIDLYFIRLSQFMGYFMTFVKANQNHTDKNTMHGSTMPSAYLSTTSIHNELLPIQVFLNEWIIGILIEKVIYSIIVRIPDSNIANTLRESLVLETPHTWNISKIFATIGLPITMAALSLVTIPAFMSYLTVKILSLSTRILASNTVLTLVTQNKEIIGHFTSDAFIDYILPSNKPLSSLYCTIVLIIIMTFSSSYSLTTTFTKWSKKIRDDEYIVGKKLHNNAGITPVL